jgi:hypothetical protein
MPPELGPVAGELRVLDRRLLTARGGAGRDAVGGMAFAVALAALVAEIVAWQAARGAASRPPRPVALPSTPPSSSSNHPAAARQGRARVGAGPSAASG